MHKYDKLLWYIDFIIFKWALDLFLDENSNF